MRRLLCLFCPPLAVLSCGFDLAGAIVNCFLMIFFYIPAVAHAWRTVTTYEEDQRTKQITSEIRALQEPLLLQVHSNLLAANAMMPTPTPRRQRALPEPEPELIDDPYIGVNGKVFRRRR